MCVNDFDFLVNIPPKKPADLDIFKIGTKIGLQFLKDHNNILDTNIKSSIFGNTLIE